MNMLKLATLFGNKHGFVATEHVDYDTLLQDAVRAVVDNLMDNGETADVVVKLAEPVADKFIKHSFVSYPDDPSAFGCPFFTEDVSTIATLIIAYAQLRDAFSDMTDPNVQRMYEEYKKMKA